MVDAYPVAANAKREEIQKWFFLRDAPAGDALHADIQAVAQKLWDASLARPWQFVNLAACAARDCIKQIPDTVRVGHEDIAGLTRAPQPDDAVDAYARGADDCDAKARFFVALCLCRHIPARMVPWWNTQGELQHVSADVYLGKWLPVETTLSRARVGETGLQVPKEKNGKWLTSP